MNHAPRKALADETRHEILRTLSRFSPLRDPISRRGGRIALKISRNSPEIYLLGSVQLSVNNTTVIPQVLTKVGNKTTIKFSPNGSWTSVNNTVRLVYADSNLANYTNTWSFNVNLAGGSATQVSGQWDFDFGDLRATVGNPLQYFDPTFDGPNGSSANKTTFGTCSDVGVPLINGQEAIVMKVPGDVVRNIGYVMTHGIAPNGGGTKVNQYTLIMDVLVDTTGPGAASLLQASSLNNTDDGDLFWQGGNFGQGTGGYTGYGTCTAGAWHRVVAAFDLAANPPVVTKYVDGIKQADWIYTTGTNLAHSLDAPRRALQPAAILFADGDQDERRAMWVNSIQIRAGALSKAELAALSVPAAGGIPVHIDVETGPVICYGLVNSQFVLNWSLAATGYTLESTTDLSLGTWNPVTGVANNSKVLPLTTGNLFFRLVK